MTKKFLKSLMIATFIFLIAVILVDAAQQYYRVNNGASTDINEWSVCKKVTNNTGKDIFVPTNTSNEWNLFRTYYPTGISLGNCGGGSTPTPTCNCWALGSGWWYCEPMCCWNTCGCNISCLQGKCSDWCASFGGVSQNCSGASGTCKCLWGQYQACSNWGTCQNCP